MATVYKYLIHFVHPLRMYKGHDEFTDYQTHATPALNIGLSITRSMGRSGVGGAKARRGFFLDYFFSSIAILGYNAISRSVVNTSIANGHIYRNE